MRDRLEGGQEFDQETSEEATKEEKWRKKNHLEISRKRVFFQLFQ